MKTSKTLPSPITALNRTIRKKLPRANIQTDAPTDPGGPWFFDISLRKTRLCVQWQKGRGFGITFSPQRGGYGESPTEIFGNDCDTAIRVVSFLRGASKRVFRQPARAGEFR